MEYDNMVKNDTIRPGSYATVAEAKEGGGAGGDAVWGSIEGTLSNQTDLKNALDGKQDAGDYATEDYVDTADAVLEGKIEDVEDEVSALKSIGKYLANWNCTTGLPASEPPTSPYEYKTGDYYVVSVVGDTNYIPNGTEYVEGQASTTTTTETVKVSDIYFYDGSVWRLLVNSSRTIAVDTEMSGTSTNPVENKVIKTYVDTADAVLDGRIDDVEGDIDTLETTVAGKQDELTAGDGIDITNNVISSDVPVVSVSDTGSTTNTISYITIDGVEKKIAGGTPENVVTTNTEQTITANKIHELSVIDGKYDGFNKVAYISNDNKRFHTLRWTTPLKDETPTTWAIVGLESTIFSNSFKTSATGRMGFNFTATYNKPDDTNMPSFIEFTRTTAPSNGGCQVRTSSGFVVNDTQIRNFTESGIADDISCNSNKVLVHPAWVKSLMPEVTFTADGETTSYDVSHTLGKIPSIVQVTDDAGVVQGYDCHITKTANTITVQFDTAPEEGTVFTVAMLY